MAPQGVGIPAWGASPPQAWSGCQSCIAARQATVSSWATFDCDAGTRYTLGLVIRGDIAVTSGVMRGRSACGLLGGLPLVGRWQHLYAGLPARLLP